jgi:hypothetical protein
VGRTILSDKADKIVGPTFETDKIVGPTFETDKIVGPTFETDRIVRPTRMGPSYLEKEFLAASSSLGRRMSWLA